MDTNVLLSISYDSIKLSIPLPNNPDINVIVTSPYQASARIGMYVILNYKMDY